MKRSSLSRSSGLKQRTPMKKTRRRALSAGEGVRKAAFQRASRERRCATCTAQATFGEVIWAHHVVEAQELRRRGADLWDVRNMLPLCGRCHANHHGVRRLPFAALTEVNLEFAREVLGDYATDYLDKFYPGRVRHGDDEEAISG